MWRKRNTSHVVNYTLEIPPTEGSGVRVRVRCSCEITPICHSPRGVPPWTLCRCCSEGLSPRQCPEPDGTAGPARGRARAGGPSPPASRRRSSPGALLTRLPGVAVTAPGHDAPLCSPPTVRRCPGVGRGVMMSPQCLPCDLP